MMTTPTMSSLQPEWSGAENLAQKQQESHRLAAAEARKRRIALRSQATRPSKMIRRSSSVMLVEPTVIGVREIARRLVIGQTVAIPTECTYESVSLMTKVPFTTSTLSKHEQQPHVYVTEHSLKDLFEANQSLFPTRQYAFRKDGQVKAIAAFNETFEVTKRLATKLWPGPVLIALALTLNENDSTEESFSEKQVYIQLRSPCHPLAVKSLQQYQNQNATSTDTTKSVLVGKSMVHWTGSQSVSAATTYVTDASACLQHGTHTAILNGESPQELFHVPTCERKLPPSRVTVDMSKRTIQVSCKSHLKLLQQTLHGKMPGSTTVQDQILQAVLHKWTVVMDGLSSVEAE
ncbi:hypothetical protein MPSEU_001043400 [Mayamaea pseudoterrestris]|nr:hypothetical protein MPSEU_001043400 [Mayamaea pseudoterrestris]